MQPIEQVVFHLRNDYEQGKIISINLIQKTQNIEEDNHEELLKLGNKIVLPSKKAFDVLNLFFYPLSDKEWALGRLTPDFSASKQTKKTSAKLSLSWENILTDSFFLHFLIVSSECLTFFGNNPVLLYQTLLNQGRLPLFASNEKLDIAPLEINVAFSSNGIKNSTLETEEEVRYQWDIDQQKWFPTNQFSPFRRSSKERFFWKIDQELLQGLAINPGTSILLTILESILQYRSTLFVSPTSPLHFISGILNLLPFPLRPCLTFASGLEFSSSELFRLNAWTEELAINKQWNSNDSLTSCFHFQKMEQKKKIGFSNDWVLFIGRLFELEAWKWFNEKMQEQFVVDLEYLKNNAKSIENETNSDDPFQLAELNESGWVLLQDLQKEVLTESYRDENLSKNSKKSSSVSKNDSNGFDPKKMLDIFDKINNEIADIIQKTEQSMPLLKNNGSLLSHSIQKLEYEKPLMTLGEKDQLLAPCQQLMTLYSDFSDDFLGLDFLVSHALKNDYFSFESLYRYWNVLCNKISLDILWDVREKYIQFLQALLSFGEISNNSLSPEKSMIIFDILNMFLTDPCRFQTGTRKNVK
ncbi:MAG: hypothetical protein Q4C95_02505 [Planctomycetia bacterium]|nr:hypothetical protein [Planctomycetia bacterium]